MLTKLHIRIEFLPHRKHSDRPFKNKFCTRKSSLFILSLITDAPKQRLGVSNIQFFSLPQ